MSDRRFWSSVGIIWAVAALLLVVVAWTAIAMWRFPDPDDQMRLLQVRNLLAGQSWFDVSQYRLNPPAGVPMHWSRLVDLPIAAVILLCEPVLGAARAEHAALVVVPLMTLGVALALVGCVARRVLADEPALFAVCLAPLCVEVMHQLRPMRIDHHGWQMVLALVATVGLLDERRGRGGAIAGAAIAAWLAISLEGLPMVAAVLTLVALIWVATPDEGVPLMRTTTTSAAVTSLALFAAQGSSEAWRTPACDAVSPPYLAALGLAALGMIGATWLPLKSWIARLGVLALVGVIALCAIPLIAPACIAGPFAQLDPLVRELWYLRVMEGLPIWQQSWLTIFNSMPLPLLGVAGGVVGWRRSIGAARTRWAILLFLTTAATVAAILVQRSSGAAALIAAPGAARLLHPALVRARTIGNVPARIVATLAILIVSAPGLLSPFIQLHAPDTQTATIRRATNGCVDAKDIGALRRLPTGQFLAPLDIAPAILLFSSHSAVASGHHRGATAMHDVIAAFSGSEAAARAIIARRGVNYVAFCPGMAETIVYEHAAPAGFLAMLDTGRAPTWLTRVEVEGSSVKLWRVD